MIVNELSEKKKTKNKQTNGLKNKPYELNERKIETLIDMHAT